MADLSKIKSLREATRAGAGIYWDFASGSARRGRMWHDHAPDEIKEQLCRDVTEDELKKCREVSRIDQARPVAAGSSPVVLVIIGPSGAGKSMVLPKAAQLFGLNLADFAEVDGDDMRGCHSAWKKFVVDDAESGYFDAYDIYITNKKNKGLKVHYLKEILESRKNVIYPDTHVKEEDLKLMKEKGYKVYTLGLLISCAESDCRQQNRAEVNGRWAGTPEKKWLVTLEDVIKMCDALNSDKALAYESTDVLNPRLVYARGVAGLQDPNDLQGTFERLKTDASWKESKKKGGDDHAWCEGLSLAGCYTKPDGGEVKITLDDYTDEVTTVRFEPSVGPPGFKCCFSVKACTLNVPGESKKKVGDVLARFLPVTLAIEWCASAPWGAQKWELKEKIPGHSIKTAIREDAALTEALCSRGGPASGGVPWLLQTICCDCAGAAGGPLNFCATPFRGMTDIEWAGALEACCVTGANAAPTRENPKALIVMAPSAGGKTTVVAMLASFFGIELDRSVRADGAIFRDFHKQYAKVCDNGVANAALWYNAWPAAKSIVQGAKKKVMKTAVAKKQDLIISDTGAEVDRLEELVKLLNDGGYVVSLVGIYADPQAILKRGVAREIGEGKRYNRSIPKLKQTFEHFGPAIRLIDGQFMIVHNAQGQKPQVQLEGTGCKGGELPDDVAKALEKLVSSL